MTRPCEWAGPAELGCDDSVGSLRCEDRLARGCGKRIEGEWPAEGSPQQQAGSGRRETECAKFSANARMCAWLSIRTQQHHLDDFRPREKPPHDLLTFRLRSRGLGEANAIHAAWLRPLDNLGVQVRTAVPRWLPLWRYLRSPRAACCLRSQPVCRLPSDRCPTSAPAAASRSRRPASAGVCLQPSPPSGPLRMSARRRIRKSCPRRCGSAKASASCVRSMPSGDQAIPARGCRAPRWRGPIAPAPRVSA